MSGIMCFKLCVLFISLVSVGGSGIPWGPRPWNDMFYPRSPQSCDIPVCEPPCPGAAPPRKCPTANTTVCPYGCACITYCDTLTTVVCYETKHCERRRFLGAGRKRKTTRSIRGRGQK